MAQNEFIVTRKRRRSVPSEAPDPSVPTVAVLANDDISFAQTSSSIKDFSSTVPSSPRSHGHSNSQLTVEGFLQWSAGSSHQYNRHKKPRVVRFSDGQDGNPTWGSDEEDIGAHVRKRVRKRALPQLPASDDEYQPSEEESSKGKAVRRKRSSYARPKSLVDRMLHAAVLSHVDVDCHNLPSSSDRQPLKFATKSSITPPSNYLNAEKARLVDPRSVSMHSPAFRKPVVLTQGIRSREAISRTQGFSRWACTQAPDMLKSASSPRPSSKKAHVATPPYEDTSRNRPPLTFVATRAPAVHNYSPRRPHRSGGQGNHEEVLRDTQVAIAAPPLDFELLATMKSPRRPRALSPTSSLVIISSSEDEAGNSLGPLRGLSSSLPAENNAPLPGTSADVGNDDLGSVPHQSFASAQSNGPSDTPLRIGVSPDDNRSWLKPLASYMNDFTETARKVTQSQSKNKIIATTRSSRDARR